MRRRRYPRAAAAAPQWGYAMTCGVQIAALLTAFFGCAAALGLYMLINR